MAKIVVNTTEEEQQQVLETLRELVDTTIAVSAIAKKAGMSQTRVRYVLVDLEESNKIRRIPTKAFNPHYIRYKYEVLV